MEAHDACVRQKIVERGVLHVELGFGRLIGTVPSEIQDADLEPFQPLGDGSSDIAESDKADGLIAEFAQVRLIARTNAGVGNPPEQVASCAATNRCKTTSISMIVCSATLLLLKPGLFAAGIPAARMASTSRLS